MSYGRATGLSIRSFDPGSSVFSQELDAKRRRRCRLRNGRRRGLQHIQPGAPLENAKIRRIGPMSQAMVKKGILQGLNGIHFFERASRLCIRKFLTTPYLS